MSDLETAIAITSKAFDGKTDEGGRPYILHCLHVMHAVEDDEELMCAAVMHDLIEDTSYTLQNLQSLGFSSRIVGLVGILTRRQGESYADYLGCIKCVPDAVRIKLADLQHSSDASRIGELTESDQRRMKRYRQAIKYLSSFTGE